MLMVKAGDVVDQTIDHVLPFLEPGDIIIDGGNSLFTDSNRRTKDLAAKGILFIGTGVSGGEEGARFGPSIMPGGNPDAWPHVKHIFQAIAAKVEGRNRPAATGSAKRAPATTSRWSTTASSMATCSSSARPMTSSKTRSAATPDELATIFTDWNKGELDSYLIEISANIFAKKDEDGAPIVDKILDTAGQKGTGKWTVISALDLGMPVTLIGESVFARCLSAIKEERVEASKSSRTHRPGRHRRPRGRSLRMSAAHSTAPRSSPTRRATCCSAQAAKEFGWQVNMGGIALMWRGGCIIRSRFLGKIKDAYDKNPALDNLLLDDFFSGALNNYQASWRKAIVHAIALGVPTPAFSTALAFYDGYRTARLPANLLQAQRDFFGAHTYERVDQPRGKFFHTNWTGHGGRVSSSTYNA